MVRRHDARPPSRRAPRGTPQTRGHDNGHHDDESPRTDPDNEPGQPHSRGTLPMARHLTYPAIEEEIQALAASAPPMTEDQRAKLARLLRLNRRSGAA